MDAIVQQGRELFAALDAEAQAHRENEEWSKRYVPVLVDALLEKYGIPQNEIARRVGMTISLLSRVRNGREPLSRKGMQKLLELYENGAATTKNMVVGQLKTVRWEELDMEILLGILEAVRDQEGQ